MSRKRRPKKCRQCGNDFDPWNSTQVCCTTDCALKYVKHKQETKLRRDIKLVEKEKRAEHRKAKESLKTRRDYEKEAQVACNSYIRERDKDDPCISCGTTNSDIQYCAGHFKTVGSHPELRYHPLNINKQCNFHCNSQKSGNISKYRPELIKKIGLTQVEWLEGPQEMQNRTIDDLIEIRQYYKEQLKIIKECR